MKKKLLAAVFLIAAVFPHMAKGADGKFTVGPQGGLVFSDYSVKNAPFGSNYKNDNGLVGGIFFEMGIWAVTLRPELNYVEKKYTVFNTAEVTNKYLEIPLLLKINPFGQFFLSPFILLGPSWSHHWKSDVKFLGTTTTFNNGEDGWDIAGVAGAGVEFNVSDGLSLQLQGRYNFGFRDMDKSSQKIQSRGIYALGGLGFQF